ncbi:fructose-1,6-bisphosphatase, partial [Cronobacter sakazakii]
ILHPRRPFFVGTERMVNDVGRFIRELPDA